MPFPVAAREADAAFGDGSLYLERQLPRARHGRGPGPRRRARQRHPPLRARVLTQRRRQKVIEEAPAPGLAPDTRSALLASAASPPPRSRIRRREHDRVSVEGDSFYFLEMNTRIQVEHGVTEMITGFDIVKAQLRIAGRRTAGCHPGKTSSAGVRASSFGSWPRTRSATSSPRRGPSRPSLIRAAPVFASTPSSGPAWRSSVLRLAGRQAARLGQHPTGGACPRPSRAVRARGRRDQDDNSAAPGVGPG